MPQNVNTASEGGYLVKTTSARFIAEAVLSRVGAFALAMRHGAEINPEYTELEFLKAKGDFVAEDIDEGEDYPVQDLELDAETIKLVKFGFIHGVTDEFWRSDKKFDLGPQVQAKVLKAFVTAYETALTGYKHTRADHTSATAFDFRTGVSDTVELDSNDLDGYRKAVSQAIHEVGEAGFEANGIVLPTDIAKLQRDARPVTTVTGTETTPGEEDPIETTVALNQVSNLQANIDPTYGLDSAVSSHLPLLGTATSGKVVGVVGDFSQLDVIIHAELEAIRNDAAMIKVGEDNGNPVYKSGFGQDFSWAKFRNYGQLYSQQPEAFRLLIAD